MIAMGNLLILKWHDEWVQETYIFRNARLFNAIFFSLRPNIEKNNGMIILVSSKCFHDSPVFGDFQKMLK